MIYEDLDLEGLERKAQTATRGPWGDSGAGEIRSLSVLLGDDHVADATTSANAAYIAMASPDLILRLIDTIRTQKDILRGAEAR